ncbi:glycoside hydrolase family 43 protein [Georgenia halophila]|uniref:Glycoside hydrolase family 43 protein n=1 Tax=Georgenia halophila TaxID=620889 RepID=A0ABP8L215_9MICO
MLEIVNPVIRGFATDPSIIRVDDWYYVATSSFQWFPTIPLHRSADLAAWEHVGSVTTAAPGGSLAGLPDSGGVWAPSLSHDGDRFWVTYAIVRSVAAAYFDLTVYATWAREIGGPWSEPIALPSHGFDPSLFHHEGRHYLLNLQNDSRPEGRRFDGIVATEVELDEHSARPVGTTRLLLQRDNLLEGPKLYHHTGRFYLVAAEGGTGWEHGALVARGENLFGPYEVDHRPFVTTRDAPDAPLQKTGHVELVEAQSGAWFATMLASRPVDSPHGPRCPLGRETVIQPITWVDGWPRLRSGGHHPEVQIAVDGEHRAAAPAPDAVVQGLGTSWPWSTLRSPPGDWADTTTRPGWLRLVGQHGPESHWAVSLVAQRLAEHKAQVEVTIDAEPTTFTQSAGLVLMYDATAYLTLHVTWAEPIGEAQHGQQWSGRGGRRVVALVQRDSTGRRTVATHDLAPAGAVQLAATIEPTKVTFDVDGVSLGDELDITELSDDAGRLRFTGTMVGVSAHDTVDRAWTADFTAWTLRTTALQAWDQNRTPTPAVIEAMA